MLPMTPEGASAQPTRRFRFGSDISSRTLLFGLLLLAGCLYFNLAEESYLTDFHAFYLASVVTHDHLDPYVNHVNQGDRYIEPMWWRVDSRFIYPPTALFFCSPFGRLPYKYSKLLFAMTIVLTMIGILDFFHCRHPEQTLVLFALFLSLPMITNVDSGQSDVIILALLLSSFYLKNGWKAGVCLGIAIAIKFAPVMALIWFVGDKRWRTAAWGIGVSGALAVAALLQWGPGYYLEFIHHLLRHTDSVQPTIPHRLTGTTMVDGFLLTQNGSYVLQHDIIGYVQNPLHLLARYGSALGVALLLVFSAWLFLSRRGRGLRAEQSFFLFLVAALFANYLLWPMGLVACFPLSIVLIDSAKTPKVAALALLAPLMMTVQLLGHWNFVVWVAVAGYWVYDNGWLNQGTLRTESA